MLFIPSGLIISMVKVDAGKWGEVKIDGKSYFSDMYVYWDGRTEARKKGHLFDMDEFVKLLQKDPGIIVIGMGHNGIVKVPDEVLQMAENKKIELFMEKTPQAAEVFNAFVKEGKRVIAVLHSTC